MSYQLRTSVSWSQTMQELGYMFEKWGVGEWEVRPMRLDSRKTWWPPEERVVTIRFVRKGETQEFSLGTQERPVDNLRALFLGLDSIRMNERRGIGDVVREMYLRLPAPPVERDPYDVLGVRPDTPMPVIEAAYKFKAHELHPDKGGSEAEMRELNAAYERVKTERSQS